MKLGRNVEVATELEEAKYVTENLNRGGSSILLKLRKESWYLAIIRRDVKTLVIHLRTITSCYGKVEKVEKIFTVSKIEDLTGIHQLFDAIEDVICDMDYKLNGD